MGNNFNVKWIHPITISPKKIRKDDIATFSSKFVAEKGFLKKASILFFIKPEGSSSKKLIKTITFKNVAAETAITVETKWRASRTGEHTVSFILGDVEPKQDSANCSDDKLTQKFRVYERPVLTRAEITSFSVNGIYSATVFDRIVCRREHGIQCEVRAEGPQPIEYRYLLFLTDQMIDFPSQWVSQNSYTISLTYDQVLLSLKSYTASWG